MELSLRCGSALPAWFSLSEGPWHTNSDRVGRKNNYMARLNYQNLNEETPGVLLREVFDGLKPYHDYLNRTLTFLESRAAVLRLAWKLIPKPNKVEDARQNEAELDEVEEAYWVELTEPSDRPNEPEGTFKAFLDEDAKSVYEYEAPDEEDEPEEPHERHKFRNDDEIGILNRDPLNNRLQLERIPERPFLLLRPNTSPIKKQLKALASLREVPAPGHLPLLRLLARTDRVQWPEFPQNHILIDHWDVLTDKHRSGAEEQRRFVETALNTPDFALLEGPPGSGKTTVILELILQYIRRGMKVILCASTHVAVDNVLERLMEPDLKQAREHVLSIRIGDISNVSAKAAPRQLDRVVETEQSAIQRFLKHNRSPTDAQRALRNALENNPNLFGNLILTTANLVCGTTIGILQHPEFRKDRDDYSGFIPDFDVLILDEASKTTFQEFLVPALLAKRWIIVGDPRQLSPYVDEDAMAVNVRSCLPDAEAREACLTAFRTMNQGQNDPMFGDETGWEHELAWRISRVHELRLSKGETVGKLESEIKELISGPDADEIRSDLDRVRKVALPSVLDCLLHGFDHQGSQRHRTTLTDGFERDQLQLRHAMLTYQHRMHPEIAAFSREHIYLGEALLDAADVMEKRSAFGYRQAGKRAIWLDVAGQFRRETNSNPDEAAVVATEIKHFTQWARQNPRRDGGPWEVAVLTFYRGQERELRNLLRETSGQTREYRRFEFGPNARVELCTVDRFQGHEADVVFISFANTRPTNFLESMNRLNVALTRPRYHRVIIGNRNGFLKCRAELLRKLAEVEQWEQRVAEKRHVTSQMPTQMLAKPANLTAPAKSPKAMGPVLEIDITDLHGDQDGWNWGGK